MRTGAVSPRGARASFGGSSRAGTPTAVQRSGTSVSTTAFAPTRAPLPTVMSPSTLAPGVDEDVVADRRAVVGPGEPDRDLLVDPAVPADPAGRDDRGEAVLDEEPRPDVGAVQVQGPLARVDHRDDARRARRSRTPARRSR